MATTKKRFKIKLEGQAKEMFDKLTPEDQLELYRSFEMIAMDPTIGEPVTKDTCPAEDASGPCFCGEHDGGENIRRLQEGRERRSYTTRLTE